MGKNMYKMEFYLSISGEKRFKLIEYYRKSLYLTKIKENIDIGEMGGEK